MGYSTFIIARTTALRDEMLAFLNAEVSQLEKLPYDISGGLKNYWVDARVLSDVAKSGDQSTALGYERNTGTDASLFFMSEVLKWAASKVGKRIKASKLDPVDRQLSGVQEPDQLVPFVVYGGEGYGHATRILDYAGHLQSEQKRLGKANPYVRKMYTLKLRFFEVLNTQPQNKAQSAKQIGRALLHKHAGINQFNALVQSTIDRLEKKWETRNKATLKTT